ncbi:hypothetical protein D3C80_1620830 [compost metagenome]
MGRRRVRQQVDHVIGPLDPARQVRQRGHFGERRLLTGAAGNTVQGYPKRLEKLGYPLADIAGADDQHLAPLQRPARAVVPAPLHLAQQARQHFAFMAKHVGEHVFRHHLTKNAHRTRQAIIPWQAVGQQRCNARPGRLHPGRLVALA